MRDSNRSIATDPAELTAPVAVVPDNNHYPAQQEDHQSPLEEAHSEESDQNALSFWAALAPGDVVSLGVTGSGEYVGTVESKTGDGLIIWFRDSLNDRKLFHVQDCQYVQLLT